MNQILAQQVIIKMMRLQKYWDRIDQGDWEQWEGVWPTPKQYGHT